MDEMKKTYFLNSNFFFNCKEYFVKNKTHLHWLKGSWDSVDAERFVKGAGAR